MPPAAVPPTGIVLLDSLLRVVYQNQEACNILAFPMNGYAFPDSRQIAERVGFALGDFEAAMLDEDCSRQMVFVSGRRRCLCQIVAMQARDGNGRGIAVLLTRAHPKLVDLSECQTRFHLTPRESQVLQLVAEGLSSKEIAERMRVSANTVKVFVRLIMVKMGVGSRSAVLAKLLRECRRPSLGGMSPVQPRNNPSG